MVVDDHPMWRDAVERDLQAAGFDVVAVAADGTRGAGPASRRPARRWSCSTCRSPAPNGVEVTAQVLAAGPVGPGADPLGLRRAGRRPRRGQGRRDRLPGEVGVARRAARRRTPGRRRATRSSPPGSPAWCSASSGGWPTRPARPETSRRADRARDRGAQDGREGHVLQADRRAARDLPPHRAEPRAEHPAQAADAQPRAS